MLNLQASDLPKCWSTNATFCTEMRT